MIILNSYGHDVRYCASAAELSALLEGGARHVMTVNPEYLATARQDAPFGSLIARGNNVMDGAALVWQWRFERLRAIPSRWIRWALAGASLVFWPKTWKGEPSRLSGSDMPPLLETLLPLGRPLRVALLGGETGNARAAKEKLEREYGALRVVYAEEGPRFATADAGNESLFSETAAALRAAEPDVLFVGFGAPKQDFWLARWLPQLPSVRLGMGIGGAIDYWSGNKKRAPRVFRSLGLEWAWRLAAEPRRFRRILTALGHSVAIARGVR